MIDKKQKQLDALRKVVLEHQSASHLTERWLTLCNEHLPSLYHISNLKSFSMLVRKLPLMGFRQIKTIKIFCTDEGRSIRVVFSSFEKKGDTK